MKRRHFGLMATSGLAAAATLRPALAQAAPDPTLLTTTLTPLGAERAGNADGSIPAWTGGMTEPSTGPVAIEVFPGNTADPTAFISIVETIRTIAYLREEPRSHGSQDSSN